MERQTMKVRIANAPVSWGVYKTDLSGIPSYDQVLDEIHAAGYKGTELGPYGYLPAEPAILREALTQQSLELVSAFVPIDLADPTHHQEGFQEAQVVGKLLAQMGCEWIVLSAALFTEERRIQRAGRIRPEDGLDEAQWDIFARATEQMAVILRDEFGLKTVFHPHVASYVETPIEIDALLHRTDPELIGLCLDTGHIMYGGGDPITVGRRWSERVRYVHLKDCSADVLESVRRDILSFNEAVRIGVFPELGKGSIDFIALRSLLAEIDFDGWMVVEQDVAVDQEKDPLASARRNRVYLERIGF
jgi:inosose dehydratase